MIEDPKTIKYHLEMAVYMAKSGRPGPVWIDIPFDLQFVDIDIDDCKGFTPEETKYDIDIIELINMIKKSKRPIILAGNGIKLSGAVKEFRKLIDKTKIPIVTTWNTHDIYPGKLHIGCIGLSSTEATKELINKCDLIIGLGTHFSLPLVGRNYGDFLPNAKKIVIDIDNVELDNQLIRPDLKINCDAKFLLKRLLKSLDYSSPKKWIDMCINKEKDTYLKQHDYVNPMDFINTLSNIIDSNTNIVIDGGGTIIYITPRVFEPKNGQNIQIDSSIAAMGSGLPNSIGAYFANKRKTVCLCGDGSLQMNIQELQTIKHHNIPIKIFIMNNCGYLAIRHTQSIHMENRFAGSCTDGGLSIPNYKNIANAYGIDYISIDNDYDNVKEKIKITLNNDKPMICEFYVNPDQKISGGLL
jgi:acetolactate synthase-1/2/3 large subunit